MACPSGSFPSLTPLDPEGPIRQALEDAVRTQEVLIRGEIPQKAITWLD